MRQKLVSFQLSGIEVRRKKIKINLDEDFFCFCVILKNRLKIYANSEMYLLKDK